MCDNFAHWQQCWVLVYVTQGRQGVAELM